MEYATNPSAELARALELGEIVVYFQPQASAKTGRIVAAEALCRWQHPERGLVFPDEFIPMAESTGLIREIGMHVLRETCRFATLWSLRRHPVETSLNVSPVQLADAAFYDDALAVIDRYARTSTGITVEVTERLGIDDMVAAAAGLQRLREAGVGVAIDDFGTGHSSVDQLRQLPTTELKIDRSLVQDLSPGGDTAITEAVHLAHDLAVRVVAEGVETEAQLARAQGLGCDRIQGYLVGKAVPPNEFEARHLAA